MTIAIDLRYDDSKVRHLFNALPENVKKQVGKANYDYTKVLQRHLRNQLTKNGTTWRGKLWNSIQAKKMSDNRSVVTMAYYGRLLDSMRPHHVQLRRGKQIYNWAISKGGGLANIAKRQGMIYVRPHPFIERAKQIASRHIMPGHKRRIRRAIRESKR